MADSWDSKHRSVIEFLADFNLNNSSISPTPIKINCLAISSSTSSARPHESLFYIGTLTGNLFLLSLNPTTNSLSLLKHVSISNGIALVSIHAIRHMGKIIVLSADGFLYLLDNRLLEPVKKITVIKGGVTALSRRFFSQNHNSVDRYLPSSNGIRSIEDGNLTTNSCFFVVAAGRKLVFLELGSNCSVIVLKETQGVFDGIVNVMVWIDDSVISGSKSGYYIYSCLDSECRLIFSLPESSGPPQLKLLSRESRVLLLVDNVGIIVDAQGQPVGGSLVFRSFPDSLAEIGTYVAVVRTGKLELYHKRSGICGQMLVYPGNTSGSRGVLADEDEGKGELVALVASSKVVCYRKVPWEEQIKGLLRKKYFKEAMSLVEELHIEGEIAKEMLSFVHAQVGFLLLFELHFEEAVNHFLLSETMQPSEVFPFIMRDPNRWSLLVPRNRYWGLHPPPIPLENVVDDGLKAIQRAIFLRKAGVETAIDNEFLVNPPSRADLLESAIKNMIRYLQASREKDLTPSVKEGVDTLLMYLYRALDYVDDMETLASSENSCVVEELESLLNDSGHLQALAFLYSSKGMSSKALTIWRLLARNYSAGFSKSPARRNGLQDASIVTCSWETAVKEASKILEESSDQNLVLQHLGWIAEINQALAVQILISEKRSIAFSPDEVISAIDPKKVEILQRYLQWLIEDQDSDDTQFHTMYALLLAKSALQSYEVEHGSQIFETDAPKVTDISHSNRDSLFENPIRERLQIFLQSSDLYDPEDILDLIEDSELWLEKAILYRKLGQETLVLQILALKLEDCEAAEEYCAEIGRPDAYMQLLEMYLDPKDGKEPMFKAAVRLLHNHGEALDPLQVLERLSPDMPLQLASDTILRMLRARHHHHRQGQIVHNLSHALAVDASLARLEERSRHVLINDESVCDSCHARLGTKLFAMYPDDTIVCYKKNRRSLDSSVKSADVVVELILRFIRDPLLLWSDSPCTHSQQCYRRQGESTSITGRNFKHDELVKPGWLVTR